MQFSKWHGLGNDYLLVERAELALPLTPERVQKICDYHFGVGSDGIVEVLSTNGAGAEVEIWNPDGSTAELSGNGTRIAARWLAERSRADEVRVRVGDRVTRARIHGELVEQELGPVEVGSPEELEEIEFVPVSVGNPHAVVQDDPAEIERIGRLLERHARFPDGTNVQVARVDGPGRVTARVWERGVGETSSSGTSAVAVAAALRGEGETEVRFPGGTVLVRIERGNAYLVGPAERV